MRLLLSLLVALTLAGCRTGAGGSRTLDATPAPDAQANDAFVAERAHNPAATTSVLGLYNTTQLDARVDALPQPEDDGPFEYWPFVWDEASQQHPWPYPEAIGWGYGGGSATAQKCMKLSWNIFNYVMAHKPANLVALSDAPGAPVQYFQWNNDYTRAHAENQGFRSFWHYNSPGGLIKWISNTKMDGSCQHPTVEAIDRWAACEIKKLRNESEQCPGHQ